MGAVVVGRRSVLVGVSLALFACGGGGGDQAAAPEPVTVEMYDNRFEPAELSVDAGTELVFTNLGVVEHDAVAVDGSFETPLVEPDGEARVVVEQAGTVAFFCSLHAPSDASTGMVGELTVSASTDGDAAADTADGATDADDAGAAPDARGVDPAVADARIAAVEPVAPTGEVRRVPEDFPTIQTAVDAADPGDLVLIGPGTYPEQVTVTTPQVVVRGTDRAEVIIDGQGEREMGVMATADGVAVENLTVRDVTSNGVYWDGVTGFRGSYLTALNAGTYGIYAFDSVDGVFEHSYASGSADGGYYVGQCEDCRTILNQVTAEWNGFGFSGTNASNSLYLVDSVWRHNGAGIVPNTLDSQRFAPSRGATIAGNLVHDNGNFEAPVVSATWPAFGHGIMLAGGIHHDVHDNVVVGHPGHGIATTPNLHRNFWMPGGNVVADNLVAASGRADVATVAPSRSGGDCFADNEVELSAPAWLTQARRCDGLAVPSLGSFRDTWLMLGQLGHFPGERRAADVPGIPPPPNDLPQLPDGAMAEVRPAVGVFASYDGVDLDAVSRPDVDVSAWTEDGDRPLRIAGVTLRDVDGWSAYFLAVGWLLPALALLGLAAVALVDVARRTHASSGRRWAWLVAVGVPAALMLVTWWPVAVVVSLAASVAAVLTSPRWSRRRRWSTTAAGVGILAVVTPALVVVGLLGAGVV